MTDQNSVALFRLAAMRLMDQRLRELAKQQGVAA